MSAPSSTQRRASAFTHFKRLLAFRQCTADCGWFAVRFSLAACLGIAAISKLFTSSPDQVIWLAAWELALAVWLVSNVRRQALWWATTGTFAVFLAYAARRHLSGHSSCGCFGSLEVPPWATALLDLAALGTLFATAPFRGFRLRYASVISLTLLAVAVWWPKTSTTPVWWDDPANVGRPPTILDHIDIGPELRRGQWNVLFVRPGCASCRAELERVMMDPSVSLVQVMPPGSDPGELGRDGVLIGYLDGSHRWAFPTPVLVSLEEGVVVTVASPGKPKTRRMP